MSFLSSEQRAEAVRQQVAYDALLVADLDALVEWIAEVSELRRVVKYRIRRFKAADAGEGDADSILSADNMARNLMFSGITHLPVVVTSGEKRIVRAHT